MEEVVVGMVVEGLDRFSYNGAKRLEVVVGQEGQVVLEVLEVRANLAYLGLPSFQAYLVDRADRVLP